MRQIPIIVFGAGGVGGRLLQQIVDGRETVAARAGVRFDVVAVADSRRWCWEPAGLTDEQLRELMQKKVDGTPIGPERPTPLEILATAAQAGVEGAVLVDVTAAEGMNVALDAALAHKYGVVLANKKPLAAPWPTARRYYNNRRVRHESTVGGGQPVIATLRYLLDTGDPILRIEGQLSGTLGFICQQLDHEVAFSTALASARAQGFTEPDPREDLSGEDVMRKALILARMVGWPVEAEDVTLEPLYPEEMADLGIAAFMEATSQLDAPMAERVAAAREEGQVLRYLAVIEDGAIRVGLAPVPATSPLANLKYVSFRTGRYDDEPLLIGGKGAGVAMTAAGVHGDLIALAREVM